MRTLVFASVLFPALTLVSGFGNAGDTHPSLTAAISDGDKVQQTNPKRETYRGYYFDLATISVRADFDAKVNGLRQQVDMIENVGLSHRVLEFFRTVPILVDEFACIEGLRLNPDSKTDKKPTLASGCYSSSFSSSFPAQSRGKLREVSVWENRRWNNTDPIVQAIDNRIGVAIIRTRTLDSGRPVLLHEMLHAYHFNIVPQRFGNDAIKYYYEAAKGDKYPADAYFLTNEMEFFAVTATVFLTGKADGGITPSQIENMSGYSNYLRWLFEVDPPKRGTPVASVN